MSIESLIEKIQEKGWKKEYLPETLGEIVYAFDSKQVVELSKVLPLEAKLEIFKYHDNIGYSKLLYLAYGENYHYFEHIDDDAKTEFEKKEGHWPYIPYHHDAFMDLVRFQWRYGYGNFIDVGCGIGDKVFLSWIFNHWNATGIEYNEKTFKIAKELEKFNPKQPHYSKINFIQGDAKKLDYHPYKTIYMYMPIFEHESLCELYKQILETMPLFGRVYEVLPNYLVDFLLENGFKVNEIPEYPFYVRKVRGERGAKINPTNFKLVSYRSHD